VVITRASGVGVGDEAGVGETTGVGEGSGVTVGRTIGRKVAVGCGSAVGPGDEVQAVIVRLVINVSEKILIEKGMGRISFSSDEVGEIIA
jgi:hypothetical protein